MWKVISEYTNKILAYPENVRNVATKSLVYFDGRMQKGRYSIALAIYTRV